MAGIWLIIEAILEPLSGGLECDGRPTSCAGEHTIGDRHRAPRAIWLLPIHTLMSSPGGELVGETRADMRTA